MEILAKDGDYNLSFGIFQTKVAGEFWLIVYSNLDHHECGMSKNIVFKLESDGTIKAKRRWSACPVMDEE